MQRQRDRVYLLELSEDGSGRLVLSHNPKREQEGEKAEDV